MKPQLYSIFVLLLSRINSAQNLTALSTTQDAAASSTQLPLFTSGNNTTSIAETPDDNVTSVTEAPNGNATSVTKASDEATIVSEAPDDVTFVSEAPDSNATSAPSTATSTSPASNTTRSTTGITNSATILTANQTFSPDTARNTTTQWTSKVNIPNSANSTTYTLPRSIKPTIISVSPDKTTGNRTSTFPVPSLFAISLLAISVLCF